jgi:hypothetical protein
VPKINRNPFSDYGISEWKWEFLRRNARYKRAYEAIEWLKRRAQRNNTSPFFKGFGLREPVHFVNLLNKLRSQLSLCDPKLRLCECKRETESWSLPSPSIAAHEFEYSPVRVSAVIGLYDQRDFGGHYSGHPHDEEPAQLAAGEHEVIVVLDTRGKMKEITSELAARLDPYLSEQRPRISKYKDYLDIWDLWQKGYSADEIALKLYPEEYETKGGRDVDTGEKGSLDQKVYDRKDAAQKLIDETFPQRNRPKAHIKK